MRPVPALAHDARNHRDEVRRWLGEARAAVGTFPTSAPWWDRVEFRRLLWEAESRVGVGQPD